MIVIVTIRIAIMIKIWTVTVPTNNSEYFMYHWKIYLWNEVLHVHANIIVIEKLILKCPVILVDTFCLQHGLSRKRIIK